MTQRFGAVLGDTAPGFTIAGSVARPVGRQGAGPPWHTPEHARSVLFWYAALEALSSSTAPCAPRTAPREEAPMKAAEG